MTLAVEDEPEKLEDTNHVMIISSPVYEDNYFYYLLAFRFYVSVNLIQEIGVLVSFFFYEKLGKFAYTIYWRSVILRLIE
ncbi:hypothetical protein ACFX13_002907 [Malus domestica]